MQTPARPRPRSRLTDVVIEELNKRLDARLYRAGDKLPSEHALCMSSTLAAPSSVKPSHPCA